MNDCFLILNCLIVGSNAPHFNKLTFSFAQMEMLPGNQSSLNISFFKISFAPPGKVRMVVFLKHYCLASLSKLLLKKDVNLIGNYQFFCIKPRGLWDWTANIHVLG